MYTLYNIKIVEIVFEKRRNRNQIRLLLSRGSTGQRNDNNNVTDGRCVFLFWTGSGRSGHF